MGVPCIELTNTLDDFAWLVQWVECILQSELWKTSNHATIGHMYYKLASTGMTRLLMLVLTHEMHSQTLV